MVGVRTIVSSKSILYWYYKPLRVIEGVLVTMKLP